jgi:predicted XRE-type DNA-binding protein
MDLSLVQIIDIWEKEGGLVTINLAAEIIGITQPAVSVAVDKGKIKSYHYKKKRYLSFNDVMKYMAKRSSRSA